MPVTSSKTIAPNGSSTPSTNDANPIFFPALPEWTQGKKRMRRRGDATMANCGERSESRDPREFATDGQLVHGLGAFVSDHALQVEHMPDRHILGADAGAAEHVTSSA